VILVEASLELSEKVSGGVPVFNFAVAKVRYRALTVSATDVRVFFRLFPVVTTSLECDLWCWESCHKSLAERGFNTAGFGNQRTSKENFAS